MPGLLEQLSPEDQAKVKDWSRKARTSVHERDIPPELFIGAKLGYYYGWEAKVAFGRGYNIGIDENGKLVKIPYTFDEAVADVRSAEKVHYRKLIESGDIIASANISSRDKNWATETIKLTNKLRKEVSDG